MKQNTKDFLIILVACLMWFLPFFACGCWLLVRCLLSFVGGLI